MRIVCLSDTHNLHHETKIPYGDILIHGGDITAIGNKDVIIDFNYWLGLLPHKYKIVIAGNHDYCFESDPGKSEDLLTNAIFLNNSGVEIEGLKIWGSPNSPISPKFGSDGAFNIERGQKIRKYWELIPSDTDILITHCPPFGILDKNEMGDKEGCKDLLDVIQNRIKPRLHIFGHIHDQYGQVQIGSTNHINASVVDLKGWIANYKLIRKLRIMAISVFQVVKFVRKTFLGVSKEKLYHKTLSHLQWEVKNKPIVIDL